jgi:hypothetical protein
MSVIVLSTLAGNNLLNGFNEVWLALAARHVLWVLFAVANRPRPSLLLLCHPAGTVILKAFHFFKFLSPCGECIMNKVRIFSTLNKVLPQIQIVCPICYSSEQYLRLPRCQMMISFKQSHCSSLYWYEVSGLRDLAVK